MNKMEVRNLVTSLVLYEAITTTKARAKACASLFEWVINTGKKGGFLAGKTRLTARRNLKKVLTTLPAQKKVIEDLARRFENVRSGYTHQLKIDKRKGDNAPLVFLKLTREKPVSVTLRQEGQEKKNEKSKVQKD